MLQVPNGVKGLPRHATLLLTAMSVDCFALPGVEMKCRGRSQKAPTQSLAVIARLRRIAISL
jgi:hypothetical protein